MRSLDLNGRGFMTPKRRHNDKKTDVRLTLDPYFNNCKHTVDTVKSIDFIGFKTTRHKCSWSYFVQFYNCAY